MYSTKSSWMDRATLVAIVALAFMPVVALLTGNMVA